MKLKDTTNISEALTVLGGLADSVALKYKIVKLLSSLKDGVEQWTILNRQMFDNYLETDGKGNFIKLENGAYKIKEGCERDCNKMVEELDILPYDCDSSLFLTMTDIENCDIPFNVMAILSPVLK